MSTELTPELLRIAADHAEQWREHGTFKCARCWENADGFL